MEHAHTVLRGGMDKLERQCGYLPSWALVHQSAPFSLANWSIGPLVHQLCTGCILSIKLSSALHRLHLVHWAFVSSAQVASCPLGSRQLCTGCILSIGLSSALHRLHLVHWALVSSAQVASCPLGSRQLCTGCILSIGLSSALHGLHLVHWALVSSAQVASCPLGSHQLCTGCSCMMMHDAADGGRSKGQKRFCNQC